jgi:hypothetical protein
MRGANSQKQAPRSLGLSPATAGTATTSEYILVFS